MNELIRPWVIACFSVTLACLMARPERAHAQEDPSTATKLEVSWVNVPKQVLKTCASLSLDPAANANALAGFNCSGKYWVQEEVTRMGETGASLASFHPGGTMPLCEAAKLANGPAAVPGLKELLKLCGYEENPGSLVATACKALDTAIQEKEAKITALTSKTPAASDAEDLKSLNDALAKAKAAKATGLCSLKSNDLHAWDGIPGNLPVCAVIVGVQMPPDSAVAALHAKCGLGRPRSGGAAAAVFITPILQGLGDFLQARAKEELVTFAVEQLGRKFCEPSNKSLHGEALFPETCGVLFPKNDKGEKGDANIESIFAGRFRKALARDLAHLPIALFEHKGYKLDKGEESQLGIIFEQVVRELVNAPPKREKVLEFFSALEGKIRDALDAATKADANVVPPLTCNFAYDDVNKKLQASAPCGMMLFLTAAAQAKPAFAGKPFENASGAFTIGNSWLESTAVAFCKNYGGGNAECLMGKSEGRTNEARVQIRAAMEGVVAFHDDLVAVARTLDEAKGKDLSIEAMANAASGVASAFHGLTSTLMSFAKAYGAVDKDGKPTGAQKDLDRLNQVFDVIAEVFKAVGAATKQDYKAIAASLRIVFDSPLIALNLDPEFKQGIFFVFDIAEAKDREAVRKVFEDYAAPVGSYRAKYQAKTTRVNVNGMVGFLAGIQAPLYANKYHRAYEPLDLGVVSPLSALVGIDVSGPAVDGTHHFGAMFTLIDPLALRVTAEGVPSTQVDFEGVLAPGAFFRWGMWKSPLVLMLGVRTQPLLKSIERNCGHNPCWQAPVSGMVGLAVDIPMFSLN